MSLCKMFCNVLSATNNSEQGEIVPLSGSVKLAWSEFEMAIGKAKKYQPLLVTYYKQSMAGCSGN